MVAIIASNKLKTSDGKTTQSCGWHAWQAAAKAENPLDGWTPSVPKDGFQPSVGSDVFMDYEDIGAHEVKGCCFVIPAGGLGERLGFSGVKFALPAELVTGCCVLEVYCAYLRAFQTLAEQRSKEPCRLPLVIMASGDTELGIKTLLQKNKFFGLEEGQVTILLQEKVAALANGDALLSMDGYKVGTKPHGHGDVHFLLHASGLVRRWHEEGRKWILFFQDTSTLYLTTFLCSLGVSAKHGLHANVVTMPRKAKEAAGSIARLTRVDGRSIVANVEYNQLEPLLKATGSADGDVNGPDGFSPYPGNTNELIFSLPDYLLELEENGGQMPEFINPKYTDESRTTFKSPTRLECMMQDFLRVLKANAKVGFTRYPLTFGYFPCKNDIVTAARLASQGTPPHGAASAEAAVYDANCTMLRLLGVDVAEAEERHWKGGPQLMGPAVVLWPSFAPSMLELKKRLTSPTTVIIASKSSLEIRGDVYLGELHLNGALRIEAGPGVTLHIPKLKVQNQGQDFVELTSNEQDGEAPEELRIRGYRCITHELEKIEIFEAGVYTYTEDKQLKQLQESV